MVLSPVLWRGSKLLCIAFLLHSTLKGKDGHRGRGRTRLSAGSGSALGHSK